MAETEHPAERIAKAVAAEMFRRTILCLNLMFLDGGDRPFVPPKVTVDVKGKRPWFTHALTPAETRARFADEMLYSEDMQRLLAQVAKTGDWAPVRKYGARGSGGDK